MKKFLLLFVVLLAGSALYGKFQVENNIEEALDTGIMLSSRYADISYGKAVVNLDSSISIKDINIYDNKTFSNFLIEEVKFYSSNNWRIFTSFFRPIEDTLGKYILNNPDKITFSVSNLNMSSALIADELSLCGDSSGFETASLTELGLERINIDFFINLDATNKARATQFFSANIDGIGEFDISSEMDLEDFSPASVILGTVPEPKTATLGFKLEKEYASKFFKLCADKHNMNESEYAVYLVGGEKVDEETNFTLPEESIQAINRFINEGARLEVESTPKIKFSELEQLKFYKDEDKLRLLGLTIRIDGEELPGHVIEESVIGYIISKAEKRSNDKLTKELSLNEKELPELKNKKSKSGFHKLQLSDVKNYIGHDVRVYRKRGKPITGKILSYSGGMIKLQQRIYGGSVDYQIARHEIKSIEAYF